MMRFKILFFILFVSSAWAETDAPIVTDPSDNTQVQAPGAMPDQDPTLESAGDTPVSHQEIEGDRNLTVSRPWRAPLYEEQTEALGWSEKAFATPKGLERNVQFWIDIYTKYSTDQGVVHDAEYIDLIYEVLDFNAIMMRTDINIFRKEALKIQQVNRSKQRVTDILKKLERTKDPETLNEAERKVWNYFEKIDGKKKFKDAQDKNRTRFQLGQRDRVIQGIFFSGRYLEDFEKIFKDAKVPLELTRLPFVESSFNVLARSKVGASGLWQIMSYTGRGHMTINEAVDKRNHPIDSARLAAKLLRQNFQMLKHWPLAVTGYNHGPSGVLRLSKIFKSTELGDFFPVGAKKRLGFASRNFFASFLAIVEVEKNAPKYFGNVTWSQPLAMIEVRLPMDLSYSHVKRWFEGDDHKAQIFNPHINSAARKGVVKISKGASIGVPLDKEDQVRQELANPKELKRMGN